MNNTGRADSESNNIEDTCTGAKWYILYHTYVRRGGGPTRIAGGFLVVIVVVPAAAVVVGISCLRLLIIDSAYVRIVVPATVRAVSTMDPILAWRHILTSYVYCLS